MVDFDSIVRALSQFRDSWTSKSRLSKRMIIASAIILDSCIGLLYQSGSLNLVDWVLAGSIPNDLVWLTQVIEGISGAFFIVKILFDDLPVSYKHLRAHETRANQVCRGLH